MAEYKFSWGEEKPLLFLENLHGKEFLFYIYVYMYAIYCEHLA